VKNLDYKTYVSDPEIRHAIEREARRARHEVIDRFIFTPLTNVSSTLLKRALQALLLILTLANYRFYSPGRIPGSEFTCNTQPRS
jgi:hypothetical protein